MEYLTCIVCRDPVNAAHARRGIDDVDRAAGVDIEDSELLVVIRVDGWSSTPLMLKMTIATTATTTSSGSAAIKILVVPPASDELFAVSGIVIRERITAVVLGIVIIVYNVTSSVEGKDRQIER